MIDTTTITDGELAELVTALNDGRLAALMATANRELERRRTVAEIPRRLEAALVAAEECGIEDVDSLVTEARERVRTRPDRGRPERPTRGRP